MLKKLIGRVLALALGMMVLTCAPAGAQDGGRNCPPPDFDSQAAAQAYYRADPSDPDGLDDDKDGVACETTEYPAGSPRDETPVSISAADAAVPTGGTSTGFGGMADELAPDDAPNRVPLYGGLALAAVGIGWTATRRRRHA